MNFLFVDTGIKVGSFEIIAKRTSRKDECVVYPRCVIPDFGLTDGTQEKLTRDRRKDNNSLVRDIHFLEAIFGIPAGIKKLGLEEIISFYPLNNSVAKEKELLRTVYVGDYHAVFGGILLFEREIKRLKP